MKIASNSIWREQVALALAGRVSIDERPLTTWRNAVYAGLMRSMLLLLAGCGGTSLDRGPTGNVSGVITYEGTPVQAGTIFFEDVTKGLGGHAKILDEGRFSTAQELPQGRYAVFVSPPLPDDPTARNQNSVETLDIPERYRSFQKSGLIVDVIAGQNQLNIELKK